MRLAVLTTTRVHSLLACSSAPGYTHFAHGVEYEGPGYQETDLPYQQNLAEASRPPRPTIQEDQHMSSLPPGPRSVTLQTIGFARDPFGTLRKYARRYGDPFTLKLLTGPIVSQILPITESTRTCERYTV